VSDLIPCWSSACLANIAETLARPYKISLPLELWCHSSNNSNSGFLLVKVPKAASSTSAGIVLRIARRNRCSDFQWKHQLGFEIATMDQFDAKQSFLLSTIRDPGRRALSTLDFHLLSRQKVPIQKLTEILTDDMKIQLLLSQQHPHNGCTSQGQGGFQVRYMSLERLEPYSIISNASTVVPDAQMMHRVVRVVRDIMNAYGFLIVTEHMDESLVALSFVLGVSMADIFVSSSKIAGTYHLLHHGKGNFTCLRTITTKNSPRIWDFLESKQWRIPNLADYLLHTTAYLSLNLTIQAIGQQRFQKALNQYRHLKTLENSLCPTPDYPCSADGTVQIDRAARNCALKYYDFECGYPCIDDLLQKHFLH
jgi:hypothetical protein